MDKYLIKTTRKKPDIVTTPSSPKKLKQKTLHSLKGVVVVEDIERLKSKLELPTQSKSIILSSLLELGKKIPPRNILLSTKIGHTVNKLRKHPDQDVSRSSRIVLVKWKNFYQDHMHRPQIEVKCDTKTENLRQRGKTLLSDALRVENDHKIVDAIERETFHQHKRLVNPAYRRSIRTMIFKLMHNEELRNSVTMGNLSVEDFVKEYKKS